MKKLLVFTAAMFSLNAVMAQVRTIQLGGGGVGVNNSVLDKVTEIGTSVMEFTYDYAWATDTTDVSKVKKDVMLLQVGNDISKFFSYRKMQIDSLIQASTPDEIMANPNKYMGGESFAVYKNSPQEKLSYTDRIGIDWFYYEEEIPVQEWVMIEGEKEIEGYKCNRAECDFRGRKYIAWYSEEIPMGEGPWKFGGLPGLIMEVADSEGHYSFILTGIRNNVTRPITKLDVQFFKVGRDKFLSTKRKFDIDPIGQLQASGMKMTITTPDGQPNEKIMAPRELKYDYMERDVKY